MTDADYDKIARDILEEIGKVVKIKPEKRDEVERRIKAALVSHDMRDNDPIHKYLVACVKCNAPPGKRCWDGETPRESPHPERGSAIKD